jgi:succinyl-diaminopimelate desuccinylase
MTSPDAVEIARRLIARRSVTPADDGALPYLRDLLAGAGFIAEIVSFAEPGMPTIDNLYARIGARSPHIVFAGHTDVVPPGDPGKWRFDPFSGQIAEGMIWGRGACDMKGGLAAALAAALRVAARGGLEGSISFLVTGDEEGPAVNGTVKLLEWARARGERFDHCILGEPTSREALGDMMKIGRRGSLTGRLTLIGKQGHVAYPQLARNPIRALAPVLAALQAPALDVGTPSFEASNLEVVSVDVGNGATNVIPGELRLVFNVRFNDLWTPRALAAEIERRIAGAADGASYDLQFDPTNAVAFLTPSGPFTKLVSEAVHDIVGRRPVLSTSGGTSDARFIQASCPVVELGLVGQTMHGVDERVPIADIETLARIYERALELYFAAFATR